MRAYSLFTIFILCIAIGVVDALSFYWLQNISQQINYPTLRTIIYILFWFFTIALISAILILKVKLDNINPRRKQLLISSFYGLTISSFIPKFIFVVVLSLLYFTNFMLSDTESVIVIPLIGLFSGIIPFFVIIYGIFKTIYSFKVYREKIHFSTLPKSFEGTKIVHISDLHLGSFNYRFHILDRAIYLINDLNPDYIFFTGDLVNNFAWELKGWEAVLKKLSAKKGKFAVLGNHDYGDYYAWKSNQEKNENFNNIKNFYSEIDFKLLLNEAVIINNTFDEIAIIGVENWGKPPFSQYGDLEKSLKEVTDIPFKILLTHNPSHWNEEVIKKTNIALTLSGHTHGMQAGINIRNKKWSPIKYKYKQWAGLYKLGTQYLYVNRGLGWLGFPGRIGMKPEITCIELLSK